ncbi:MAG: DUF3592 domain-containing protein [Flavobacteriaceae bacterium]
MCFLLLGTAIVLIGIHTLNVVSLIKRNGINGKGEVLFYESDNEGYKTPIIKFTTKEGKIVERKPYFYVSSDLSKIRSYKKRINKIVPIRYNPKNPEEFIITHEGGVNKLSLIFIMLVGLIFFSFAIANLLGYVDINF